MTPDWLQTTGENVYDMFPDVSPCTSTLLCLSSKRTLVGGFPFSQVQETDTVLYLGIGASYPTISNCVTLAGSEMNSKTKSTH